jgi:hypothetical protein
MAEVAGITLGTLSSLDPTQVIPQYPVHVLGAR